MDYDISSGDDSPTSVSMFKEAGVQLVVTKPIRITDLVDAINSMIL
jgi:hypothetical protein